MSIRNMKLIRYLNLSFLLLLCVSMQAQVTIGNDLEANPGAILDLKQTQTAESATLGLGLPRVELKDFKALKFGNLTITDSQDGGNQFKKHIGLVVFNAVDIDDLDICATSKMLPGTYVWTGTEWEYLIDQPTEDMSYFAYLAGFSNVQTRKISDADDQNAGIDTPDPTTGIAWHRDQDGNVFFSSSFDVANTTSNSNRWMITNLAAKTYADNRDDGGAVPVPNIIDFSYKELGIPQLGYPNAPGITEASTTSIYKTDPRVGVLYNWDAATKGKVSGSNEGGQSHAQVQGICPNGWHLPSDYEYTELENIIRLNTAIFSSTANINGSVIPQGSVVASSPGIGAPMKGLCESSNISANKGTSNPINFSGRVGFESKLVGYAYGETIPEKEFIGIGGNKVTVPAYKTGQAEDYGRTATFWTSSYRNNNATSDQAWIRQLSSDNAAVAKDSGDVNYLYSVRCKKNP